MDIKAVKKAVGKIKTNLFKNSNSYSIGMLRSHFKGAGLQFKEHQIYVHGDDVRFIDWRVLAKTNTPYIKTFDEERNVEIVVVIDASVTMFSGYQKVSKLQAAIELCCLLYLLAEETGDYVHVMILTDEILYIPKKRGDAGIVSLVSLLEKKDILKEDGKVNIGFTAKRQLQEGEKIAALMKHLSRRREVVLFSDFNDFLEANVLKKLLHRSNVHCFQLTSPLDEADRIPFSVFSRDFPSSNNGHLRRIKFGRQKGLKNAFGKKFKKLKIHERYLEEFIKEML